MKTMSLFLLIAFIFSCADLRGIDIHKRSPASVDVQKENWVQHGNYDRPTHGDRN